MKRSTKASAAVDDNDARPDDATNRSNLPAADDAKADPLTLQCSYFGPPVRRCSHFCVC